MADLDFLHDRPITLGDALDGLRIMSRRGNTSNLVTCLEEALDAAKERYGYGSQEALVIEALMAAL